ncbi:uncharacterized protein EV154DRAFT_484908 [Mucor mucedo]|uniref:uncharacterized protein n=1 Tax=Mucor mucedo TaxID=29922 RepID=UPI00221E7879|nr:uncharacterized protein EV154DRAFT_484908 [Mucor mucedo]KAI7887605.1 hypothetical protein EV154DRAFT_484908 [Mucor mucedo]
MGKEGRRKNERPKPRKQVYDLPNLVYRGQEINKYKEHSFSYTYGSGPMRLFARYTLHSIVLLIEQTTRIFHTRVSPIKRYEESPSRYLHPSGHLFQLLAVGKQLHHCASDGSFKYSTSELLSMDQNCTRYRTQKVSFEYTSR